MKDTILALSPQIKFEEYIEKPYINQSTIKSLIRTPGMHPPKEELYFEESTHLVFGSLVDEMLTDPNFVLENNYAVIELEGLSAKEISLAKQIGDENPDGVFIEKDILRVYDEQGYNPKLKPSTKLKQFEDKLRPFAEMFATVGEKTVVTQSFVDRAIMCSDQIKRSLFSKYFKDNGLNLFQTMIVSNILDVEVKSLLDVVYIHVDDKGKVTMRVVDLKTTSSPYHDLRYRFFKLGYNIQACVYDIQLRNCAKSILEYMGLDREFTDYDFDVPIYVFVHSSGEYEPVGLEVSELTLHNTFEGTDRQKGVRKVLQEYKDHYSVHGYGLPYDFKDHIFTV